MKKTVYQNSWGHEGRRYSFHVWGNKGSMKFLNNVGDATQQESYPENLLTETNAAAQPVDEGEGVDDELWPGDVHHLVVYDEHLHPSGLGVRALMVGLVVDAGAGGGALAGLGGVEAGVKLEQKVE